MSQTDNFEPRQLIVDAAVRLRHQGREPTVALLAKTAGVSRASVYRHLGGRRALDALLSDQGITRKPAPRERVIEAAIALLMAHGPNGFTLEQVAIEAAVSPTTVYREFADRSGLLREVIQRIGPPSEVVKLFADEDAPPDEVLTRFVVAMAERLWSRPFLLGLLMQRDPRHVRELRKLRRAEDSVSGALRRYLAAQIARGRIAEAPLELLTTAMMGQVAGLTISTRLAGGEGNLELEPRARALVTLFLHGAAPQRTTR